MHITLDTDVLIDTARLGHEYVERICDMVDKHHHMALFLTDLTTNKKYFAKTSANDVRLYAVSRHATCQNFTSHNHKNYNEFIEKLSKVDVHWSSVPGVPQSRFLIPIKTVTYKEALTNFTHDNVADGVELLDLGFEYTNLFVVQGNNLAYFVGLDKNSKKCYIDRHAMELEDVKVLQEMLVKAYNEGCLAYSLCNSSEIIKVRRELNLTHGPAIVEVKVGNRSSAWPLPKKNTQIQWQEETKLSKTVSRKTSYRILF